LRKYRSSEYAMSNSGWTLLSAADQIFKLSKGRIYNEKDEFDPDPCPKFKALIEILRVEIPSDIKDMINDKKKYNFDRNKSIKILVLCCDARSCHQLNQYLTQGLERTLFWTAIKNDISVQKLSKKYKSINNNVSGIVKDTVKVSNIDLNSKSSPSCSTAASKGEKIFLKIDESEAKKTKIETSSEMIVKSGIQEDIEEREEEFLKNSYILTMTQKINGNESISAADFDLSQSEKIEFEVIDSDLNTSSALFAMQKPILHIHTFRSHENQFSLNQTLFDICPDYVILYNTNIHAIRQIEIFEARLKRDPKKRLKVFVLMHAKTVEEQSFLTSLKREKKAFEMLIETKRTMVVPEYQDGKSEVLDHFSEINEKDVDESTSARQAGGQHPIKIVKNEKPCIIVDSREFRSDLPCLIHKRGLDIVPAMISIGDYILTPEICVERKSISDLIGSFQSGRLYNQVQQMVRFYKKALLLIEFDQNRPFHLQGKYMLSKESEVSNSDIMLKLQLLTIHFPKLRIVWSPSPYATAQLFEELKQKSHEPNLQSILKIGNDDPMQELTDATDKYNTDVYDFLLKLPGINSKNIGGIMRNGKCLKNLVQMSEKQLSEMIGNSKDGKLLHESLHKSHKLNKNDGGEKKYRNKRSLKKN
jgi:DNA excision repair protein ERCC-4